MKGAAVLAASCKRPALSHTNTTEAASNWTIGAYSGLTHAIIFCITPCQKKTLSRLF